MLQLELETVRRLILDPDAFKEHLEKLFLILCNWWTLPYGRDFERIVTHGGGRYRRLADACHRLGPAHRQPQVRCLAVVKDWETI